MSEVIFLFLLQTLLLQGCGRLYLRDIPTLVERTALALDSSTSLDALLEPILAVSEG